MAKNETTDWWENVTYSLEETLDSVEVNYVIMNSTTHGGLRLGCNHMGVVIKEASTSMGRCYVIKSELEFKEFEFMYITVRTDAIESLGK